MYINKVRFPVAPGKLALKVNSQNKTISLINEGEVNLVKTPGLTDITIDELLLPSFQKYPFANYRRNEFLSASYYLRQLKGWKLKEKPVQFKITRATPDGRKILWDTTFDVTVEDYEIIEDAEKYGMDVAVKLSMKEYRYWGVKKLVKGKVSKSSSKKKTAAKKGKARKSKEPAKAYTVKKGDTLMKIAKKQLNEASLWKSIYALNKKVIEAEAKKRGRKSSSNGHWIYPGTKLKLPGEAQWHSFQQYEVKEFIGF